MQHYNLLAKIFLYLGVALLVLVSLLITAQVILRNFFFWGIPDSIVIFENFAVIIIIFPLGIVHYEQIRVSVFYDKIASKNYIHATNYFFALLVGIILFVASWRDFVYSWQIDSYYEGILEIPEYPARFFFSCGIFIFLLVLLHKIGLTLYLWQRCKLK